jgi:hypothetical protein
MTQQQAPDDNSTRLVNQKYDELLAQQIAVNSHLEPGALVRGVLNALTAWGKSVNIALGAVTPAHFEHLVQLAWAKQLSHLCSKKLQEFLATNMSPTDRNMAPMSARDAVKASLEQLANWARAMGYPVEGIGVKTEEEFELLVKSVEQMAERFRAEQEKGAVPVGPGLYADVIDDEDFAERMKRAGLPS